MKTLKIILLFAIIIFAGIQFIPTDMNVSDTVPETDFIKMYNPPQKVANILQNACYDCHSNNTAYPWYNKVQPVSWFLEGHINEAKEHLNFSEFGQLSDRKKRSRIKSIAGQIEDGEMPLFSYKLLHKEARLDSEDVALLIEYMRNLKI
jgi:hypothetical protein